jgi:CHAT domain-containing protein
MTARSLRIGGEAIWAGFSDEERWMTMGQTVNPASSLRLTAPAIRWALVFALWVSLGSCGARTNEAVSLAEAKRVVAQFGRQGFVPPPRTVTDIAQILETSRPDPAVASANLALADTPPPRGMAAAQLAEFYFNRAAAAAQIGRTVQRAADARAALENGLAANLPFNRLNAFRNALVPAEGAAGRSASAFKERLAQLDAARGQPPGWSLSTLTFLAGDSAGLGRLDDATRYLDQARTVLASMRPAPEMEGDYTRLIAVAEGRIAMAVGKYSDAEAAYRRAIAAMQRFLAVYEQLDVAGRGLAPKYLYQANVHSFRNLLAASLLVQGRVIEAEVEARTALTDSIGVTGKSGSETMSPLLTFSRVLLEQWRLAEAEQMTRAVIELSLGSGVESSSRTIASARSQLARVLGFQERVEDQSSEYAALRAALQKDPEGLEVFVLRNPEYAVAVSRQGRHDEALAIVQSVVAERERTFGPDHPATALALGQNAVVLSNAGRRDEALAMFRRAVPALIRDLPLRADARAQRAGRVAILEAYIALLMSSPHSSSESVAEAFQIADVARDQRVLEAVGASVARARLGDPELADLARLEQDARQQIVGTQVALAEAARAPEGERDATGIATLRRRIDQLRASHAVLVQQLEQRFPSYAQLIRPKPIDVRQTQAALRSGEVLISFYVGTDHTSVWAVPKAGPLRSAVVPVTARQVREMVGELRKSLDPRVALVGEIPDFDTALSHRLFSEFLEPVRPAWLGAKNLLIVPDKALAQIPFSVLVTRPTVHAKEGPGDALFAPYQTVPWLIRETAITQLPSVSTLVALRGTAGGERGRGTFIGFGDPWFSPSQAERARAPAAPPDPEGSRSAQASLAPRFRAASGTSKMRSADLSKLPRLPDTAEEVRAIAVALNANPLKDVYLGAAVNERTLGTVGLLNRRVIVFATHGLVPGDLDGLHQPALALSSPEVSGDEGNGLLTTDKILTLRLNADWVVLSACNTAAGDGAGAEALSGLGRAFFYAGTRALLASNWPVETSAARELTIGVFQRQARDPSLSGGEALRLAEIALIDGPGAIDKGSGKTVYSYAHPIFWAPFSLIGDNAVGTTGP